jgi:membrane-associated phospholipid phosphatase
MPERVRRLLPIVVLATAVWVGGFGLLVAGKLGPIGPDGSIDRHVSSLDPYLGVPAQDVAAMGRASHFAVVVVVVLVICAAIRSIPTAVAFLVSVGLDLVAVEAIKEIVRRRMVIPGYQILSGYTFPSGHTATATVVATIAILICRREGPAGRYLSARLRATVTVVAVLIVVAVSTSMIIIRDHYFIDNLAAIPLAATITLLVAAGVDAVTRPSPLAASTPPSP